MLIIPAIDIIEGKCVRLTRGDFSLKKKYHDNPVEIAEIWKNQGATWLHVVDLDGAKAGAVRNLNIAQEIKKKLDLKVQYGGGIRDIDTLKSVIESGIDRAVLGTKVIEDKNFLKVVLRQYWGKAILSLDYDRSGIIYKNGWQKATAVNVLGFATELENFGINEMIVTDISKDGTLESPDFKIVREILKKTSLKLILAGGISSIQDIKAIKRFEKEGISGVIIGKALYEGIIKLDEAIKTGT
ncbi:MAG: 1-(5-phosphoribosyl)-5-[(5-phosphoribosylamino)methylideneamino]imidazole-4-carboxamide isomerase [Actinobacteria bacterium]|nr:1-(5-phosphoribosyl)-5-[(5-phosphoribosylamino)methylideneamino]imidazole-4-carboxamide isomerase [Actinomycetota bacterium]